jgi:hypothetical protein
MLPFWALFSCEAEGYTNTAAFMVEAIVLRQSLKSVSLCVVFADAEGKARPSSRRF